MKAVTQFTKIAPSQRCTGDSGTDEPHLVRSAMARVKFDDGTVLLEAAQKQHTRLCGGCKGFVCGNRTCKPNSPGCVANRQVI
jgi:hypothetical protein